jgi:N-glycosylase/DNA lyase
MRKEGKMQGDISEQKTAPLPLSTVTDFHSFLLRHKLTWVEVARASGVPALTVWSIDHGLMVESAQVVLVCEGLQKLTGEAFNGFIPPVRREGKS